VRSLMCNALRRCCRYTVAVRLPPVGEAGEGALS
jgi:hypothetical protein